MQLQKIKELLNHIINTEKVQYTDDIQYANWKDIIPDNWSLEEYFDIMGEIENIFQNLSCFQYYENDYFPTNILYVEYNNVRFAMTYITGQGSEFMIGLATDKEKDKLYISFDDFIELSSAQAYQKALYFIKHFLVTNYENTPIDIIYDYMYQLGAFSVCRSYVEYYKEVK